METPRCKSAGRLFYPLKFSIQFKRLYLILVSSSKSAECLSCRQPPFFAKSERFSFWSFRVRKKPVIFLYSGASGESEADGSGFEIWPAMKASINRVLSVSPDSRLLTKSMPSICPKAYFCTIFKKVRLSFSGLAKQPIPVTV